MLSQVIEACVAASRTRRVPCVSCCAVPVCPPQARHGRALRSRADPRARSASAWARWSEARAHVLLHAKHHLGAFDSLLEPRVGLVVRRDHLVQVVPRIALERDLHGQRQWNRRLGRRLARAHGVVAGMPLAGVRPGAELHGAIKARPEKVQEPSWGTAKGDTLTMLLRPVAA